MKLSQTKRMFELCRAAKVTPALVGTSGVGKTSICKQVAKEMGFEKVIILRPSLIADVGDLVGLPDFTVIVTEKGEERRTTFNSPDWLPNQGEKVMIVVDEINRTQKDIVMAMFDLIEADHPKIGKYELNPNDVMVVATLNPPTDNYTVLDFRDSAFTSRLCFIKVVPNQKVFTDWGRETGQVGDEMLDFLAKNDKFFGLGEDFEVDDFFGSDDSERGNHFKNNNRTKKKASDVYIQGKKLGVAKGIIFETIRGLTGLEAATAFTQHADNYKNIITLDDLLTDKTANERFDYSAISNVSKIIDDLKHELKTKDFDEKNTENLVAFLGQIPLDTFKGFYMHLSNNEGTEEEQERVEAFTNTISENDDFFNRVVESNKIVKAHEKEIKEEDKTTEDVPL